MKSLDEQVDGASDNLTSAQGPTNPPESPAVRTRGRVRTRTTSVVATSIVVGLATLIIHLAVDGAQNTANENAAIAKISPTSKYNAPLSSAINAHGPDLQLAEQTLAQAGYLETEKDYVDLDLSLGDAQLTLQLYSSDLLGAVTKTEYDKAIKALDASFAALHDARGKVLADIAATPTPTPIG